MLKQQETFCILKNLWENCTEARIYLSPKHYSFGDLTIETWFHWESSNATLHQCPLTNTQVDGFIKQDFVILQNRGLKQSNHIIGSEACRDLKYPGFSHVSASVSSVCQPSLYGHHLMIPKQLPLLLASCLHLIIFKAGQSQVVSLINEKMPLQKPSIRFSNR